MMSNDEPASSPTNAQSNMLMVKQALGAIAGGRVLDVATGEGNFIHVLAENLKSYDWIIGIDTLVYTEAAGTLFDRETVRFVQMDAARLGFADETFDTVSISSSLHHLEDVPRALAEMMRVLKVGGHYILRETHRDIQAEPQLTDMYLHHWVADVDSALGHTHNRTFTRQEIVDMVDRLGLCDVALFDVANTVMDPMDQAAISETEAIIDRYIRHAEALPDYRALKRRGEELRLRLRKVGIQWEPELLIVGKRPHVPPSGAISPPRTSAVRGTVADRD